MSSIRPAHISDLYQLVNLIYSFYSKTHYDNRFFDEDHVQILVANIINSPDSCMLVYEHEDRLVGLIAGSVVPSLTSVHCMVAHEHAWWVEEEYRHTKNSMALLKEFENWAWAKGATGVAMVSLESMEPDAVDKMYKKLGYKPVEHTYWKEK